MVLDSSQDGLIFVWGNFGQKLEKIDKDRLFAVAQNNADRFLSVLYNLDLQKDNIIDEVNKNKLSDKAKKLILELNKKDTLFREIHEFFKINQDNLSVGSLITGNVDKSSRFASILKTNNVEGD